MRDVIWTVIIIWVVYKVIDIFRNSGKSDHVSNTKGPVIHDQSHSEPKKNEAIRKSAQKEGEYIDFEEVRD